MITRAFQTPMYTASLPFKHSPCTLCSLTGKAATEENLNNDKTNPHVTRVQKRDRFILTGAQGNPEVFSRGSQGTTLGI